MKKIYVQVTRIRNGMGFEQPCTTLTTIVGQPKKKKNVQDLKGARAYAVQLSRNKPRPQFKDVAAKVAAKFDLVSPTASDIVYDVWLKAFPDLYKKKTNGYADQALEKGDRVVVDGKGSDWIGTVVKLLPTGKSGNVAWQVKTDNHGIVERYIDKLVKVSGGMPKSTPVKTHEGWKVGQAVKIDGKPG